MTTLAFAFLALIWVISSTYLHSKKSRSVKELRKLALKVIDLEERISGQIESIESIDINSTLTVSKIDRFFVEGSPKELIDPNIWLHRVGKSKQRPGSQVRIFTGRALCSGKLQVGSSSSLETTILGQIIPTGFLMSKSLSYGSPQTILITIIDDEEGKYGLTSDIIYPSLNLENSWSDLMKTTFSYLPWLIPKPRDIRQHS